MVYFQIRVSGRVQGVAFRHHTKLCADKLDLKGWVKNQSDGTVMVKVAGARAKVMSLIEWCHSGPSSANVEMLVYQIIDPFEGEKFVIDR